MTIITCDTAFDTAFDTASKTGFNYFLVMF